MIESIRNDNDNDNDEKQSDDIVVRRRSCKSKTKRARKE